MKSITSIESTTMHSITLRPITLAAALASFAATAVATADREAPPPTAPAAAVNHWQDARFGMFIHWGPVSLKGTEIGWSRGAQIPIKEYDNLYHQFNPTRFNADEWVAVAKAAGMKYIVLTTKHHDGFCLWDTRQTDFNIMNSPLKRDVVGELAAACKRGGIAFGTYYSTCDWHHPAFPEGSPGGRTKKPNPDLKVYDAYLQAQVTELLTKYGPLFTVWFDVPQSYDQSYGIPMVNKLRAIQPDLMINNRAYSDAHHRPVGDYDTPEQRVGGFQLDRPWETCMTICRQWAWKPGDTMKSLEECLHTLIRTNGGNGNLLFNVGPMPTGEIEPRQVQRLKEMGAWLATNGESIYGTRGGPWKPTPAMACTRKDKRVFLHLLKRTDGPLVLKAPPVAVTGAKLLGGAAVPFTQDADALTLNISPEAWQPIDTVIELTLADSAMDLAPITGTPGNLVVPEMKATASAVYDNDESYSASRAIDGDPETRWATPVGTRECWLQLDLGKPLTFDRVEIDEQYATPASRVKRFELQSQQGSDWTTFHAGTALGEKFQTTLAKPVTARLVRLRILDASEGPTISEVRLIAPAKPVSQ